MNVVYPVLIYYFIFSACVIKGSCDSCRNETVDVKITFNKLKTEEIKKISNMKIKIVDKNEQPKYLEHRIDGLNFEKIRVVTSKEYNLEGLLLFEIMDKDLKGNDSNRYIVYSSNSYSNSNKSSGDSKTVSFIPINFFVPSPKNDGKYVLGSDDEAGNLFIMLKENDSNSTLITTKKKEIEYVVNYEGSKDEDGKDYPSCYEYMTKDNGGSDKIRKVGRGGEECTESITVSIKSQLLESRKK